MAKRIIGGIGNIKDELKSFEVSPDMVGSALNKVENDASSQLVVKSTNKEVHVVLKSNDQEYDILRSKK